MGNALETNRVLSDITDPNNGVIVWKAIGYSISFCDSDLSTYALCIFDSFHFQIHARSVILTGHRSLIWGYVWSDNLIRDEQYREFHFSTRCFLKFRKIFLLFTNYNYSIVFSFFFFHKSYIFINQFISTNFIEISR